MSARCLISVDDLTDAAVDRVLVRASAFADGQAALVKPYAAALFLQPSLRTHVGFGIACARMGGQMVDAVGPKFADGMSSPERLDDALSTLTGTADLVVARAGVSFSNLPLGQCIRGPFISGGDADEHPTQALIDVAAMEREKGPVQSLRIGICGDLTSRCARSLLRLLRRRSPAAVVVYAPPARAALEPEVADGLAETLVRRDEFRPDDLDVLVMVGLAEGSGTGRVDKAERLRYSLHGTALASLPDDAVVLSPMPVIDELGDDARRDPRLRMFEQADFGTYVRMAVIEEMLNRDRSA